ncbi:MAG: DNA polymerase I [Bacteroidales bacterium]|nr:DNA polymerase I [Bacteroidales bacterium]
MKDQKTLFLVDAYALIFRSYYAFIRNPRFSSKGLNTSAIFGFTNTLVDLLQNEKPSHIAVVFDPPGPTFRNNMFKEYKANREATPEDIKKSVPYIKDIIKGFNIPVIEVGGYEADDVIGTVAYKAEKEGFKVYMFTPDKDYGQLVGVNILQYKPGKAGQGSEILGIEEITQRYGIERPGQVIDILALAGDSADNVPGAKGVGEKTAIKLIDDYGSVENLLLHIEEIKGKLKENIENSRENILLSKKLVTLEINVPVEISFDDLEYGEPDKDFLQNVFADLEFKTIATRLFGQVAEKKQVIVQQPTLFDVPHGTLQEKVTNLKHLDDIHHKYLIIREKHELQNFANELLKQKEFCFDTETTGLNPYTAELVGMAFCIKAHEAYYIPVSSLRREAEELVNILKPALESKNIRIVGQNIKYDILIMHSYGVNLQGEIFDTMIAHYLLQPELRHNMDFMAENYLGYNTIKTEELIGPKGKNQGNMRSVPVERIADYACEDADITLQLKEVLEKEIENNGIQQLAYEIEMPLVKVLAIMECNGVSIDTEALNNYDKELKKEIITIEEDIYKLAGFPFNISSPKQLGEVLFDHLKLAEKVKMTKTKQYSTSEEVLEKLKDEHEIVSKVLEYRSLKKLLSTYIEVLPRLINEKTGLIHTSYDQAWVATGRLSSKNPNLQNIPIREERGREIRKSFIPRSENNVLLSADYSQIELRLMAHLSEDENMIEAFKHDEDIHAATAAKIFNVDLPDVTNEMRSRAKTANFGIIYGITDFGLAQRLNIPRADARALIEGYFKTYTKVSQYMQSSIEKARKQGYVTTLLGRKRYLRDINSKNGVVRGFAERNAINAPIQGTAADIIKIAMVKIQEAIQKENLAAKMILQVHDELVFDVPEKELEQLKRIVKIQMESAYTLKVPLVVDMGEGNNWLEAH